MVTGKSPRRLIRILLLMLAVCAVLLVGFPIYDAWAGREMARLMDGAEREPGTPYLKGGAPVRIDRGRDRVCLLLHGFPSTPADFGDLPQALDEAGWDVWAPCLRGYGTDARDLAFISAEQIVDGAGQELRRMRARYGRVAVVGFSMGGAVATVLAAGPDPPDALVLVNPFYGVRHHVWYVLPPRVWHGFARLFLENVVQPGFLVHVNRPEGRRQIVAYKAMPVHAIGEALRIADRAVDAAPRLPAGMPVLVLLSERDGVAAPGAVRACYERLPSAAKSLRTYARSDHVLFLDYERREAEQAVVEHLAGGSAAPAH